jgi:alkylhydroperoxidase/carboxymuconolactone decarboxylase family protein YurZ
MSDGLDEKETRMETQARPSIGQVLRMMEKVSGGDPRPMRLLATIDPEFVYEQARSRKFVMDQPHIPGKHTHLIMIAAAAAVESQIWTTVFMKGAQLAGVAGGVAVGRVTGWPTAVSPTAVLLAVGISAAVGVFFGAYPARRAAHLDPIVALRAE